MNDDHGYDHEGLIEDLLINESKKYTSRLAEAMKTTRETLLANIFFNNSTSNLHKYEREVDFDE